jgi:hypothetical protein
MEFIDKINSGKLTSDDFNDKGFGNWYKQKKKLLGKGAVGQVYSIGDGEYVIKEVTPCKAAKDKPLYRYCLDLQKVAKEGLLKIPGGLGKIRYLLPNLLSEIAIGKILGDFSSYSPCFTATLSSAIKKQDVFILMDAHKSLYANGSLKNSLKLDNARNYIYFLFQISHAIMTAQQSYRFTHYDLHIENILYNNLNSEVS